MVSSRRKERRNDIIIIITIKVIDMNIDRNDNIETRMIGRNDIEIHLIVAIETLIDLRNDIVMKMNDMKVDFAMMTIDPQSHVNTTMTAATLTIEHEIAPLELVPPARRHDVPPRP